MKFDICIYFILLVVIMYIIKSLCSEKRRYGSSDEHYSIRREDIESYTQKGLLGAEHQTGITKVRNISQDIRSKP